MSRADWHIQMVTELRTLRRCGYHDFKHAWQRAIRLHPPCRRDMVTPIESDTVEAGQDLQLFDETGQPELSFVDFHREACRQAWDGENVALRHFSLQMLRDEPGENLRDWRGDVRVAA